MTYRETLGLESNSQLDGNAEDWVDSTNGGPLEVLSGSEISQRHVHLFVIVIN